MYHLLHYSPTITHLKTQYHEGTHLSQRMNTTTGCTQALNKLHFCKSEKNNPGVIKVTQLKPITNCGM